MYGLSTFLFCSFAAGTLASFCWAFANYRRFKKNAQIAAELELLISSTLDTIQQAKKISPHKHGQSKDLADLTEPGMLSTLLTVLVYKHGNVRLSMKDFMIDDSDYVSVYVDTATQEIILSMNHNLGPDDSHPLVHFIDSDDNTFH